MTKLELERPEAEVEAFAADLRNYWHPIASADEVDGEPRQFHLLGESVVVYRDDHGLVALKDLCIHRGTALSLGTVTPGGMLKCPYHGWEFDRTGACTKIPSRPPEAPIPPTARASAYQVAEAYDTVWVALDDPVAPIPSFPDDQWADDGWRSFLAFVQTWDSSAGRALENFCDWGHLPFVHPGVLGDEDRPEVPEHDVWRSDDGLQLGFTIAQDEPLAHDDLYSTTLTKNVETITLPFTVHLLRAQPDLGKESMISMSVAPLEPKRSRLYVWLSRNHSLDPANDDQFRQFSLGVFAQDKRIVESQRPEEIPLDLQAELHLKVPDAFSHSYRSMLLQRVKGSGDYLKP
jgi:phenylpropionate dioxygenase-like ring-hydroxylating dioxygenase large terminal subunit